MSSETFAMQILDSTATPNIYPPVSFPSYYLQVSLSHTLLFALPKYITPNGQVGDESLELASALFSWLCALISFAESVSKCFVDTIVKVGHLFAVLIWYLLHQCPSSTFFTK